MKVDEDGAEVTSEGKPFQTRGAATPKTRSPTVVTFSMTLTDPNPVFKVTAYLKSNISKMVRLRDKVTTEH